MMNMFRRRAPRPGAIMIVLLAAFAIAMAMSGAWARTFVRNRQQQRLDEDRLQARWLADAGVRRAAARLAADPGYNGETWRVPGDEIGRPADARVVLRVERPGDSDPVQLTARAAYPANNPRVRAAKTVAFHPPTEPSP